MERLMDTANALSREKVLVKQRMKSSPKTMNGRPLIVLFTLLIALVMYWGDATAYVLPAEQILKLMAKNFREFRSLAIVQTTEIVDLRNESILRTTRERLWLRSPGLFRVESVSPVQSEYDEDADATNGPLHPCLVGHRLLLANDPGDLLDLLWAMGIDTDLTSYAKSDGVIAYCIGDPAPERPKLLVEKERFVPILLTLDGEGLGARGKDKMRFEDYKQLENGWYPYKVECMLKGIYLERSHVLEIRLSEPISGSLEEIPFEVPDLRPLIDRMDRLDADDDHLKQALERLREKHE
jgi:hypothetical protein